MNKFLQQVYFNNTLQLYLYVLCIIVGAVLFKRYASKYLAGLLYNSATKTNKNLHKQAFCNLVVQPLDTFLVLFTSFVAIDKLHFPEVLDFTIFKATSKSIIDSIVNGTLITVFIWLCLRVIDFIALILEEKASATHDVTDNQLIVFFKDFFKVILVLIVILLVLRFTYRIKHCWCFNCIIYKRKFRKPHCVLHYIFRQTFCNGRFSKSAQLYRNGRKNWIKKYKN
jgi:MscS family membrane protein